MLLTRFPLSAMLERGAFLLLCLLPLLLAISRAMADIATCVIGGTFLIYNVLHKDWRWLKQPAFQALMILWVYLVAASLFTDHFYSSLTTALCWGRLIVLAAAMFTWLLTMPGALRKISRFNLVIMAAVMLDGYWQYITGTSLSGNPIIGHRLNGPISHPVIGIYLLKVGLPAIGLMLYDALKTHNRRLLLGLILFYLAVITLVMLSGERTSAALMLLATIVMGSILFICLPSLRKALLLNGMVMLALLALLFATQSIIQERSQGTVEHLSHFRVTPYGQLYTEADALWRQHPVFGIGAGEFRYLCPSVMPELANDYCDNHPHNIYLEWLTESGLIGLGLFLLSMGLLVRAGLRHAAFHGPECILSAFCVGMLIIALFPVAVTQSLFNNWAGISFWYGLAFALSLPRAGR